MINSHLQYNLLAWGGDSHRLELLQKKIVRILADEDYLAHTEPLYKQLQICKLSDTRLIKQLAFYHKHSNGVLPSYFLAMEFPARADIHQHNTRNRSLHQVPVSATKIENRRLVAEIPKALNTIAKSNYPMDLITSGTVQRLKASLKKFTLSCYKDIVCFDRNCYPCSRRKRNN